MWVSLSNNIIQVNATLSLQEHRCDSKSVVLVNVHADMSGYYTCEVTTQRTFETVFAKQYLLVVREYHRSQLGRNYITFITLLCWGGDWLTLFAENIYILNGARKRERERLCEGRRKKKQIVSSSGILVCRYGDTVRRVTVILWPSEN